LWSETFFKYLQLAICFRFYQTTQHFVFNGLA